MTEIDKVKGAGSQTTTKGDFVKGWTQGVFRIQVVSSLSPGDKRDTKTMVPAVHDIGLHAGEHAKRALSGHGYPVQEIVVTRTVPELPNQAQGMQVGTLDEYEDGTLAYTTERTPLAQAQMIATVSDPTTQALARSGNTREFDVQLFTDKSFDEVLERLKVGYARAA